MSKQLNMVSALIMKRGDEVVIVQSDGQRVYGRVMADEKSDMIGVAAEDGSIRSCPVAMFFPHDEQRDGAWLG
jgi:hypothetical protein